MKTIEEPKDLVGLNREELDEIYKAAGPGAPPKGDSKGLALLVPGSGANDFLSKIAVPFWQGKTFDDKGTSLINKVLCFNLFPAKVYQAESWLDGKPAVIIDYSETSLACKMVRDEIREIKPGIYLGIAYLRTSGHARAVNFALDLRK